MADALCPRCQSTRTIRTASEHRFDYWHCYACGKTFDIPHTDPAPRRRAADTRRKVVDAPKSTDR